MEWYYWLFLGIMIILTVFVSVKAMKSSRARQERLEKQMAIYKRDNELKRDFEQLSEDKINNTEDERLLSGVCMNIQLPLEKVQDMTGAFDALPVQKQYIYTLEYFGEDTKKGLSEFFKANGRPLITLAPLALREIGMAKAADITAEMLPMCDDEDEDVSVDTELRKKLDSDFEKEFDRSLFYTLAAKYIRNNKNIFLGQEM